MALRPSDLKLPLRVHPDIDQEELPTNDQVAKYLKIDPEVLEGAQKAPQATEGHSLNGNDQQIATTAEVPAVNVLETPAPRDGEGSF